MIIDYSARHQMYHGLSVIFRWALKFTPQVIARLLRRRIVALTVAERDLSLDLQRRVLTLSTEERDLALGLPKRVLTLTSPER